KKIRASQGHSIEVDLGYQAMEPPEILYHGTAEQFLASIKTKGLLKQKRHHVHLSSDQETALNVGQRHGKAVILMIQAADMHKNGMAFFRSKNGVWLTDSVPLNYIQFPKENI
ncbi:MAG: RNA 2'-phosphotransferase, partial [Bacteroidota bacterium]